MGPKRRRLALSCVACRRRKVKCDRTYPTCVRCQKGDVACDYVSYTKQDEILLTPSDESPHARREGSAQSWTEDAHVWHARAKENEHSQAQAETTNSATTPLPRVQTKPLRDLQDRVNDLETYIRTSVSRPISLELHHGSAHHVSHQPVPEKTAAKDSERALLRGKAFKTQYFGPSHGASLLLHFEELSRFVKDILLRLPALEQRRSVFKHQRRQLNTNLLLPDLETMVSLLPDQSRADALVREYFETFETTFRVLHAPTFFRKYKDFWANSYKGDPSVFLAQLLLVCATVNCSVAGLGPGYIARSSVGRDQALKWLEICESWLDLQSHKHMTLEIFQIRVLLVIAKQADCVKIKREWTASGQLLRSAMSSGLHREPTFLSSKTSTFDQEMRRRLWFTILELDVQNSIDRGMAASIGPYDWDTLPPANLHDEDFDEHTEQLPLGRPITDFTRTSFLCLAHQHLPLRLEISGRVNSIRTSIDNDSAIDLDQRIRQILDTFPIWSDNAAKFMSKDLLQLQLQEFLLLIHQPLATDSNPQSRHFYSRSAWRTAAISTMRIYNKLRPSSAQILTSCRDDLYRACLAICHDLVMPMSQSEAIVQDRNGAVALMEESVNLMEERTRKLGQGFHSYWLACSALGLVRSKISTGESPEQVAQITADRVTKLHDLMVTSQAEGIQNSRGLEDATMSTASTLVGMSGQPTPALPELDPFVTTAVDPFNAFSESLFDFDITDLWAMGGAGGGPTQY